MRTKILASLAASWLLAAAGSLPARAEASDLSFPAQSLGESLRSLGNQTKTNVLFDPDSVRNLRAPAVSGVTSVAEALTQLLAGSGLTYRFIDARTVTLIPADRTPAAKPAGSATSVSTAGSALRLAQSEERTEQKAASAGAAQEARSESAAGPQDLQEVIVTAQKRAERLIDVPQAVTVVSADDLAKLGAIQFRDFANTVPGLSFRSEGPGFTQVSMRGVTIGVDVISTVGIYVDEVPFGSSSAFARGDRLALDAGLIDMDRIEVLKGPQGTLYGASSMGGLLKYVTKRPDATRMGADVQTGVATTAHGGLSYNGAAVLNLPITEDKVALRVSGFYSHDGGYIDNLALDEKDVNRSNVSGGRADLLFTPNEKLDVRLGAFLQNITRDGMVTTDYDFTGRSQYGDLNQYRAFAEPFEQRFRLASATINYDFGGAELTSISSYQTVKSELVYDLSVAYIPVLNAFGGPYSAVGLPEHASTDKFTQEVRLAASGGRPLEWVIGAFYTDESSKSGSQFAERDLAGQPAPNPYLIRLNPSTYEEYAAFGDLTWHFTDKFNVTGGLRYARNRQTFETIGSGIFISSAPMQRSSENVVTYLANARYRFNDHATGYVRYATGYRPGGPNLVLRDPVTGAPLSPPTFDSDRLKSYEIGFKGETADRRFAIDLATFYIDWSNLQTFDLSSAFGGLTNAPGGATVRGGELALTARPTGNFIVIGSVAFQDAKMSEADLNLGAAKGERLPNVPRLTASLSADYAFDGNLQPTIGAMVRSVSDRRANFDASAFYPQYRMPAYETVDLRAGLTIAPVNLQLFVRNVLDKRAQTSTTIWAGIPQPAILQPRTIGIMATTHF